jgi:hypothetical protein
MKAWEFFSQQKIIAIYGKQYELRVSISSMSLQHINITYQVDAIIGMGNIPASTPPRLHLGMLHKLNLLYKTGSVY